MRKIKYAILPLLFVAACGSVNSTSSAGPHAFETGAYTPKQLQAARHLARQCPHPEHKWECGIILATTKADDWTLVVVKQNGDVTTITGAVHGPGGYIRQRLALAEFPPGIMIQWSTKENDDAVSKDEIEVIK